MVDYYLSFDIPNNIKDEMLDRISYNEEKKDIMRLLIKKGAHITPITKLCCTKTCISTLENLHSIQYDFNWIDPETGNNLFMEYAGCPAPDDPDDLIKTMQYLIELGSKTDLKNKEGKTAYDLAVNKEVKAFLKTL